MLDGPANVWASPPPKGDPPHPPGGHTVGIPIGLLLLEVWCVSWCWSSLFSKKVVPAGIDPREPFTKNGSLRVSILELFLKKCKKVKKVIVAGFDPGAPLTQKI